MKIIQYPDGGKYVINDLNETSLTYRVNSYEDLFLLKSIKDANPNLKEVIIPCMFHQQHDRRFNSNESFELKLVCEFINSLNFKKVKVFHPHSDVTPALLNNCEVIDNETFIRNVLQSICNTQSLRSDKTWNTFDDLILMSSDAGGFKPLIKLCKQINWQGETYSASKARDKDKLIQIVDRTDFGGKDILIIDDICVYGGTFKGLATMLKQKNCGKLYLTVSHMTVQNLGEDPVTNYFDKVFTTNSKFNSYIYKTMDRNHGLLDTLMQPKNLEIINLF